MKTTIFAMAIFALIAGLHRAGASPLDDQKLSGADNAFAFNLLKQLAKDQPVANIFISPYSAATVLQMVGNGAAGQTKTEMQQVLGTTGLSEDTVNTGNKAIAASLKNFNTNVILTTANAIWYRQGAPVKPQFIARNQQFFGATVDALNFLDPHSVEVINTWASDQTRGRITHFADGMLGNNTRLFLANTVYFKGKWEDPFKVEATKKQSFHLRDGGQKTVSMMTQTKKFTYRRGTGYQAVRLPYEGRNLAMYVFLPDTNSSPEKLLGLMNGETWGRVTRPGFNEQEGRLALPRFKLQYNLELKQPLEALGLKSAFDPITADFSGIAPQLFISAARQKTFVEVKEEGTEAAAVTGITMMPAGITMPPSDSFRMIVNRPFLFLIEDSLTGTILFIGTVFDPQPN
jgi:serine protease inhibitor